MIHNKCILTSTVESMLHETSQLTLHLSRTPLHLEILVVPLNAGCRHGAIGLGMAERKNTAHTIN